MFKTRKMSVKRGIALGGMIGYLIGLMVLFSFTFDSALTVCLRIQIMKSTLLVMKSQAGHILVCLQGGGSQGKSHPGKPGYVVITSYSIHYTKLYEFCFINFTITKLLYLIIIRIFIKISCHFF